MDKDDDDDNDDDADADDDDDDVQPWVRMKRAAVAVKLGGERGGGNQWRGVIITRESKRKYKYKLQFKKKIQIQNEGKFFFIAI